MSDKRKSRIEDVRTVGVAVADQDRALEFYTSTLGFDTRLDVPLGDTARWIEVAPDGATTTIALVSANDATPAGVETGIRFTTADAAALHDQLRSNGVDADELSRWPGVPPMFTFRDRDGNRLTVVENA